MKRLFKSILGAVFCFIIISIVMKLFMKDQTWLTESIAAAITGFVSFIYTSCINKNDIEKYSIIPFNFLFVFITGILSLFVTGVILDMSMRNCILIDGIVIFVSISIAFFGTIKKWI